MARDTAIFVAFVLVLLLSMATAPIEATRMLKAFKATAYVEGSSVASALPKGTSTTPPFAPSDKGHEVLTDMRKLFPTVFRPRNGDRFLQSVPSPGVGH